MTNKHKLYNLAYTVSFHLARLLAWPVRVIYGDEMDQAAPAASDNKVTPATPACSGGTRATSLEPEKREDPAAARRGVPILRHLPRLRAREERARVHHRDREDVVSAGART